MCVCCRQIAGNHRQKTHRKRLPMSVSRKAQLVAQRRERTRTPGVFKRGKSYVVMYRDLAGRSRQETVRTYDTARQLKAARDAERHRGGFMPERSLPFAEYAAEWIERYAGRGRRGFRETTRADYRRDLNRHAIPFFVGRGRAVADITARDVADFVAQLPQDYADASIRRILSPVRALLGTAVAEGLIAHNPTIGVSLPARDEQRAIDEGRDADIQRSARVLTTSELEMFFLCCPDRWKLYFRLLAESGMRVSESLALRWRDIQIEGSSPQLCVRRAFVRGRFGPPKSKYGRRSIPISLALADALRDRLKYTRWDGGDDLIFPAENGMPIRQENLRRRVLKPTASEAGVSWVAFHTFRHTCATLLFAQGRNAVQVQRWLGHHSPAFTLATYVHLLDEDLGGPLNVSTESPAGLAVLGSEPIEGRP